MSNLGARETSRKSIMTFSIDIGGGVMSTTEGGITKISGTNGGRRERR